MQLPGYKILEQIYQGSRTLVYRGWREADQQPVVIKFLRSEYPSFSELVQFRNQYTIAKNLNSPLIVQTYSLETYRNGYALVMEDFGGISLKEWRRQEETALSLSEFLPVAIALCDTLDILYRQRVIHKDIKPANILINPETKQVKLIDFSIASLLPKETEEVKHPNVLEGTLAYLAPEQTGRMNRGIDYRTDFYALGVTLFELLTGQLPFQSADPLEIVHCHIAKPAPSACEIKPEIPVAIAKIIAKLMAKNAEERYQSALGLKHDLEKCLDRWKETGEIKPFELGERDICDRFIIPEKLYGREAEVQQLLEAFERIAGNTHDHPKSKIQNPKSELMLVAGFSGIGKTAVVNEVHKPIVRQRGYFIKGKFDQFNRNIPFSAFVQAFRDLMGQLLSESDAQLQVWKSQILNVLGENGQIIIEVIPELERIIGQQPPAPELSGTAAQNRFNLLFQKFIQVFTTPEHPLVMFLDDLQWADSASLNLMQLLMGESERGYLLLIGAYRDNEVLAAHPLMLTLDAAIKAGAKVNTITLQPLSQASLNNMVADTLHCSERLAQPLTNLVAQKTQGNPFFATQFLKALHQDELITFDLKAGHWQCDLVRVRSAALTDDVVEFMAMQLQKLPKATQEMLKLAACIGNQFDLATLAIVSEKSPLDTATDLWKALQEGLILPVSETYKFFQTNELVEENRDCNLAVPYKFLHDRVQQAAYSLIPETNKQITHLNIGQLLLSNVSKSQREERILEIVNQLNYGIQLITEPENKVKLAQLNLAAGQKARAATAYAASVKYFDTGLQLLAPESWTSAYELTLALHLEAMDAEWLNTNIERSEALAEIILKQAIYPLDTVKVYETKIHIYINSLQTPKALEIGIQALEQMGLPLSTILDLTHELPVLPSLEQVDILPTMTDPHHLAQLRLLIAITSPVITVKPELIFAVVSAQVHLCLQHGHSGLAAFSYSWYGMLLCANPQNIEVGYLAGQIGKKLLETFNETALKCTVYNMLYQFINPWKALLRDSLSPSLEGMQAGFEVGDLVFASYCGANYCVYQYLTGERLEEVEREMTRLLELMQKLKNDYSAASIGIWKQLNLNLQGRAIDLYQLTGDSFDERTVMPQLQAANNGWALFSIYLAKGILLYTLNDYEGAVTNIILATRYASSVGAWVPIANNNLYHSLALLAHYSQVDSNQQVEYLVQVETNQVRLLQWAFHAPCNFQHKYDLVEAERNRVLGEKIDAIAFYERAITGAKANEYIQEEAIANELAAKFYLDWGKEKVAAGYMQEAYYCYAHWGAKAKTDDLEKRYPQLLIPILQAKQYRSQLSETRVSIVDNSSILDRTLHITRSSSSVSESLDFATIIKASQALSSEIQLEQLICNLMQVVMENAGAKKAALLINKNDRLAIEAVAIMQQNVTALSVPLESSEAIPTTVVNYVKRTLKTVVLDDATTQNDFIADTYLMQQQPKSVLCTPILNQGKLIGLLYLENQLTIGAFTRDRIEIVQLLCAQAAISLENARLYQQSQDYAQELERSLQELHQAQLQIVQNEKMATLGNLVAGVAHEINNPVGFLKGSINNAEEYIQDIFSYIECYQQHHPNPADAVIDRAEEIDLEFLIEDLPKLVDSMKVASERIKDISTSLRTFSRADTAEKVACNIHEGIDSTLLILKYRLKANDKRPAIQVITDYGNLPPVWCFLGQLNQVFMNILANAIDALDAASVRRTFAEMQANPHQITIRTEVSDDQKTVVIRIIDNGLGMSEEIQARIFDRLFTTKEVGKGTGLGLAIARQIVAEKHNGSIEVNSTLAQGSEFAIAIPVKS